MRARRVAGYLAANGHNCAQAPGAGSGGSLALPAAAADRSYELA